MPSRSSFPLRLAIATAVCCVSAATFTARGEDLFTPTIAEAPRATRDAARAAREELAQARLSLTRAQVASMRVLSSAEAELRNSGGIRELQRDATQAYANYNELRRPILLSLKRDEEYTRLSRERESARQVIRRLADREKASYLELLPYAKQALEAGRRMTRAEVIALALDPAVEDARIDMVNAFARLRFVRQSAHDAAFEHPGVVMAQDELAAARDRIREANQSLAMALRTEASLERPR